MRRTLALGFVISCVAVAAAAGVADVPDRWIPVEDVADRWIPVAASNPGIGGSYWSTDVWIYTPLIEAPIDVHIAFLPDMWGPLEPEEVTVQVEPRSSLEIDDIVWTLFGEHRAGSLRFRSDSPFEVHSQTRNDGGEAGTFTQGIEDIEQDTVPGWPMVFAGASNQPGGEGSRTNIGFTNIHSAPTLMLVAVHDQESGELIGDGWVELGPYGFHQADLFRLVHAENRYVDNAIVSVRGAGGVVPYLSRVTSRSGDGTFIRAFNARSIHDVPADRRVDFSLAWTSGTVIDSITYTGSDGVDVTVEQPGASPFTVSYELDGPLQFCFDVAAHVGPAGGAYVGTAEASHPATGLEKIHSRAGALDHEGEIDTLIPACTSID